MVECDLPKVEIAGSSPVFRSMVTKGMFLKRFYFVVILLSCNCFLLCSSGACEGLKKILWGETTKNEEKDDTSSKHSNDKYSSIEDNQSESDSNVPNISQDKKISVLKFVFLSVTTGVGKTSILKFLQNNELPGESYEATLGTDLFTVCFQEKNMKIQIWDFSGNKESIALVPRYLKDANAIFFVYDITKEGSFNSLAEYITQVQKKAESKTKGCLFFLLGNKLDLVEENQNARKVTTEEAQELADNKSLIFLGECSAKNNTYKPSQELYYKKESLQEDEKCKDGLRGMLNDIMCNVRKDQEKNA